MRADLSGYLSYQDILGFDIHMLGHFAMYERHSVAETSEEVFQCHEIAWNEMTNATTVFS